jgi:hypothetical protein
LFELFEVLNIYAHKHQNFKIPNSKVQTLESLLLSIEGLLD